MDSELSQVVSVKLDRSNYSYWAYLMRNFLIGKQVWKYVDGTVTKPADEGTENCAELLSEWDMVNERIVTWIKNSVEPSIGKHFAKFSSAKEVWDHLARGFTRINFARKYKLENDLRATVHGSYRSIQEFYSLMTGIWDQLDMMEPPELTSFDCYVKFREEQRLSQFLMGLRSEFEPLRRQILYRLPLPRVADVVNELIIEEARLPKATLKKEGSYGRLRFHPFPYGVLPVQLVWKILTWLPIKSLMRFKCVSRLWHSIILNPSFAKDHRGGFRGLLISEPYHWKKASRRDFYYLSLFDGPVKYFSHHLTISHDNERMGCTETVNGLLCFYYGKYSYLFNIATRECRKLPVSRHEASSCSYHLGFDPVSKLYKLLKVCPIYEHYDDDSDYPEDNAVFVCNLDCEILTLGIDSSWRSIGSTAWEISSRSVCLNGVLCWMDPDGTYDHLVAFHLVEEKFQDIPTPQPHYFLPRFGPVLAIFLCESSGAAVISHYVRGRESGMWTEHRFNRPLSSKREFALQGILPDGKVLIFDNTGDIYFPSTFYMYDQTNGVLEKTVICESPSSSVLKKECIWGHQSYHEENIISLRSLSASLGTSPLTRRISSH